MTEYIMDRQYDIANGTFSTVKREEIVRCRDCTYYDDEPDLESSMPKCWRDPDHRGTATWTQPDGFCWLGERKEA